MSAPENYVYFLRPVGADGPVKIGHSQRPLVRLQTFASWSPVELELAATTPGPRTLEARFHAMFWDDHLHGEWFAASPRLTSLIADIAGGRFDPSAVPSQKRPGDSSWTDISRFSVAMAAALRRASKTTTVPPSVEDARRAFAYGKWQDLRHRHPEDAWIVVEWLAGHGEHLSWPAGLGSPPAANDAAPNSEAA